MCFVILDPLLALLDMRAAKIAASCPEAAQGERRMIVPTEYRLGRARGLFLRILALLFHPLSANTLMLKIDQGMPRNTSQLKHSDFNVTWYV